MLRQTDATGEAHEAARGEALILSNARVVTTGHVLHGSVVVENGEIVEIHEGPSRHAEALDFAGDYLLPGLVDIHTDHFEKHLYPAPMCAGISCAPPWPMMPRSSAAA